MTTLAKKWFTRGRSRTLYVLKHRLYIDMIKTTGPLWLTLIGVVALLDGFVIAGLSLVALVLLGILARSIKNISISWQHVDQKRVFLGYPFFVLVRNFAQALGYSFALFTILTRRLRGKEVSWRYV